MTLQKIAEQCLCDLEGSAGLTNIKQQEIKLEIIKHAILQFRPHLIEAEIILFNKDADIEWKKEQFEIFWKVYDKRLGRAPAFKKWMKLKRVDIEKILETVKLFVLANPDVQYRPHPVTYINQRRWEDELPNKQPSRIPGTKINSWNYGTH